MGYSQELLVPLHFQLPCEWQSWFQQQEKVELWAHAVIMVSKGRNGRGRVTEFKTGWAVGIRAVSDCGTQP